MGRSLAMPETLAITHEEQAAFDKLPKTEKDRLIRVASKIHANTGHRNVEALAKQLRKMGAPLTSRAAMEHVKCDGCIESGKNSPSPVATLNNETIPWRTLGIDLKEHVTSETRTRYLIMVDEATKLVRVQKLYSIPFTKSRNATTKEVMQGLHTGWFNIFGTPARLRHDPEGALMSAEFLEELNKLGIELTATAGEAHWQLGIVERMIQTVWKTSTRIMSEMNCPMDEAVDLACRSQNEVDRVGGYSPCQWSFGRNPTWAGELHDANEERENLARDTTAEFAEKLLKQSKARSIAEEELLKSKIDRAQAAKHRRSLRFAPGETVFAWRQGIDKKRTAQRLGHKGQWYGPGVVLGTETSTATGDPQPGSVIWVVMNGKLWRCAPSQLRHGTERERAQQELLGKTPWTFNRIVADIRLGEYTDVSREGEPTEQPPQEPPAAAPGDLEVGDGEPAPRRRRNTRVWPSQNPPQDTAAHATLRPSRKQLQSCCLRDLKP